MDPAARRGRGPPRVPRRGPLAGRGGHRGAVADPRPAQHRGCHRPGPGSLRSAGRPPGGRRAAAVRAGPVAVPDSGSHGRPPGASSPGRRPSRWSRWRWPSSIAVAGNRSAGAGGDGRGRSRHRVGGHRPVAGRRAAPPRGMGDRRVTRRPRGGRRQPGRAGRVGPRPGSGSPGAGGGRAVPEHLGAGSTWSCPTRRTSRRQK